VSPLRAVPLAAALLLALPARSAAQEMGDLVVKEGIQRSDQYLAGNTVDVHGTVEGDLTMAGFQAGLDGIVRGDVNAAGLLVQVGGVVGDDLRALGARVSVKGWVGDGLLLGGGDVEIERNSMVGGNAMLAGRNVVDQGDVSGSLDVAAAHVEIDGEVGGPARIRSDDVVIGPAARLKGGLVVHGANPPRIAEGARIAGEVVVEPPPRRGAWEWFVLASRAALMQVGMLLVAWAWMALAPALARDAAVLEWRDPGLSEGIGISAVLGLPVAAALLAVTIVGLPVAAGVAAAWVLLVLAGYASTAVCLGGWLRARARPAASPPRLGARLLWTLLALLLLRAAAAVPWAGWVVRAGAVLAGVGAVVRAARLARARARAGGLGAT
jgi:cytoskeletal protein CcmA (bactofilin family)